jgi:choline dehydrogenase-like flavoprotein
MLVNTYSREEKQFARLLRLVALASILLYLTMLVGVYFGHSTATFIEPPLVSNAAASFGLFALLAWFAAGDVRRFRGMAHGLAAGLALDAAGSLLLLLTPKGAAQSTLLIVNAIVAAAFMVAIEAFALRARNTAPAWLPWQPSKPLTPPEKIARALCALVAVGTFVATIAHYALAFGGPAALHDFFQTPFMVNGSAVKIALLGLCMLLAALDIRRNRDYITVFVLGNALSLLAVIVTHFGINRFGDFAYPALGTTSRGLMTGALLVDIPAVVGFILLKLWIDHALIDHTRFFSPFHFRALEGISETLVDGGGLEKATPEQIVLRTDDYLSSFPSKRLWLAKMAVMGLEMMPLLSLKPPISFLSPEERRIFIDRHFKADIVNRRGIYALLERLNLYRLIDIIEAMMRFNMQLSYIGYYSNPAVQEAIGYTPFSERPEGQKAKPVRRYPPLHVLTPQTLRQRGIDTLTADVVIIGSGAAGATLAEQLAAKGREVLILEKGPYVSPDNFNEDEVSMISQLYSDGALQISQSLRFTVLQGSCVGGTTVVNNAVCFDTPDSVLEGWNDPNGQNAGIDASAFRAAQKAVRDRMHIRSIRDSSGARPWEQVLNPGDDAIQAGVQNYRAQAGDDALSFEVVDANILDCLGCGYCNIGCKYGRKLSMLDEVLPKAQDCYGPDRFRIVSEAEVERLNGRDGKITEIIARLRDGRRLTIQNPNTVIVSAGTIASSWLLMRSGIGAGELPVGRYLCFNMGSPLHGLWDRPLRSYAGLQISHYLKADGHPGFVYETWYNPPVAQALAMPGWLDTHFKNMSQYDHIAGVGVLVGTEPVAHLTRALFLPNSPDIVYTPTEKDMNTLVDALCLLGEIMFDGGAQTVFASTRHYRSYEGDKGVYQRAQQVTAQGFATDTFKQGLRDLVKGERDILLGTGHPQGGNRISATRGSGGVNGGVVRPDFRVWGYDNLYVCDASVFPGATTVNPQLTVMTMGRYAAEMVV